MKIENFKQYKDQGYNYIPVYREILADLETPLSTYLKLANQPFSYLFESVQGGEQWGRYSIIGLPCRTRLVVTGHKIEVITNNQVIERCESDNPLQFIEQFQARYHVPTIAELPRFYGGLVGYYSYDTVRYVEKRLARTSQADPLATPDIQLLLSEDVLIFDNLKGTLVCVTLADTQQQNAFDLAHNRLNELIHQLQTQVLAVDNFTLSTNNSESPITYSSNQHDYEHAVNKIKEYILAGDVMQVVLSQRMSLPFNAKPINFYRALRHLNPSPYLYFFNLADTHIVGSSPEILARLENDIVTLRPIAGTRPRGKTPKEDAALEKELLADPKELAEHLMLIDLGRNDVGRVAKTASVNLTEKMIIERYSHVMHIVSNVTGELQPDLNALDVLKATLPAGTLSGASKIRAMEIINELEPIKRGIYGGAIGYLSWQGNMDTAIAIRTAIIKDKTLHIQAGAGIVADSIPEKEWEETLNKGKAILHAANFCNKEN